MPAYQTSGSIPALYPGDQVLVFNAEQPATGIMSQQIAIAPNGMNPPSINVEVQFAGAPGAFEFDIYESDTDVSTDYRAIPVASQINAVDANNGARTDLAPFSGTFISIFCKTQNANAVNATVKITRRS
jgi:hypothetical protein